LKKTWQPVKPHEKQYLLYLTQLLIDDAIDRCKILKEQGRDTRLEDFLKECDTAFRAFHNLLEAKFKTTFENLASDLVTSVLNRVNEKTNNLPNPEYESRG
jgi:polyhydroxyalkanoate synthesis regulator phasin